MKTLTLVLTVLSMIVVGCGPLTPHVDVVVDGAVNTSGTTTVQLSLASLTTFFYQECQDLLGPSASVNDIQHCVATNTNNFIHFFGTL